MKYTYILILMTLICCEALEGPDYENPRIPGDPGYVPPVVTLISPIEDNGVLQSDSVEFAWFGNKPELLFSYKITGQAWSPWQPDTSITYRGLNEGANEFSVTGKYYNIVTDETETTVHFTVDDISGPAIWLKPRLQTISNTQAAIIDIMLEDVSDLMVMSIKINYNPSEASVWGITVFDGDRSFLKITGATITSATNIDTIGTITLDLLVTGGEPFGISGSGAIARILFNAFTNTILTIQPTSILRDINNEVIVIQETVSAEVEMRD